MLVCAEDLGTTPICCPGVLKELGIPGISVQRWTKDWQTKKFKKPEDYPPLSVATLSTHDTSNFLDQWKNEVKKEEKEDLLKIIFNEGEIEEEKLVFKNLEAINRSNSIFCILLLLEWLFLRNILKRKVSCYRFNFPGKVSKKNWSLKMPISLEDLLKHPFNNLIKEIVQKTNRN